MTRRYYNGSTSKKRVVTTPILEKDTVVTYYVEIQEWMKYMDGVGSSFVTRKAFKTRFLHISKKVSIYVSVGRNDKNVPTTEYYTSSGIKLIQTEHNSYTIKQVKEAD